MAAAAAPTNKLHWTTVVPVLALVALALTWGRSISGVVVGIVAVLLGGAVLAAVHHAEVVAHRVGEPFGSLVLAVAVTVIEVSLIVTLMLSGGEGTATLARDTVFAAVMITVNGILGISLLVGARRFNTVQFNAEGTGGALATVATLATVCLVLPTVTTGEVGPEFTSGQLAFAAIASLLLYAAFVLTQTVRHRDFFLPVARDGGPVTDDEDEHADPPSNAQAWLSLGFLVLSLVAVVGLAKVESKSIEAAVDAAGLPHSFVGVVIALLVLLPETIAAVNAARRERIQTSINLAMGSAMASIGLTIPTLAVATLFIDTPLHLGLGPTQIVLLAITIVTAVLTVVPGRATRLQASVHLTLFAAFIFLAASP
ncbi:Ca2+:H+ antiporter [Knoellia remsis]|uniref:Ca2+:H+ antiporter n=1 Tax=Knoellia remsis TaxID=407159 RepID=A0A2T0UQA2_9MICO|nr:calcium:proton antiporter [Knoellia remsis]PRY60109.1 Ca2+:H+ antiporter [Knoellia remsis]